MRDRAQELSVKTLKARKILELLFDEFPEAKSELNFSNPYQLLIAVILSAQCTDKKVNQVTAALFKQFPSFSDLAKAELQEVEQIIRQVNYFQSKSRHIIATAQIITSKFDGILPRTHPELIQLPGVGQKTANVVLSELGIEPRLAVDTHVFRVSRRLALSRATTREKVEIELTKRYPASDWRDLHHRLILHGRRTCKAQNPACDNCRLKTVCPTGLKT